MKTSLRLILRKTRLHMPQLIGLILLLIVGVCFFITLFTIVLRFEETAEEYFIEQAYADITFYGAFNAENVNILLRRHGIISAQGRMVRDFRDGEQIYRAVSLTDGINMPYLYAGRLPETETECVLLRRNAKALNLDIGDSITLGSQTVAITGLAAAPEYVYMVQNERTMMAQPEYFAVVYVSGGFYPDGYNEIVALTENGFSMETAAEAIGAFRSVWRKDQLNHYLYRSDLGEISSFAYIFPFIFAVLIAAVIYVMLKRAIQKDRRQIGTMKALGVSDGQIIGIYLAQFCFAALIGALLGCFAAMLVCDAIIGIFSLMFEVPALSFIVYPRLWAAAMFASVLICAVSGLIALSAILPLLPANAMRPRIPKSGKRIIIERISFIWKRLSFNTRYALKNALRNKGRFFAVVLGMCGSCALLVFSLGFYNSLAHSQNMFFENYINYNVIADFNPLPLNAAHPAADYMESQKALIAPVEIHNENVMLTVVENNFDMVNIPAASLANGVIIPAYLSKLWGVSVGGTICINGIDVTVSAVNTQYLGLTVYTSFDYVQSVTDEIPLAYNTLFGRSSDIPTLVTFFQDNNIDFSTIDDDKKSFDSIMESMSVLIWFMIACSVILGFTVLYSVGLINLSSREHEYMFLGVMGYPHKSILSAHIKETVLQLIIALPFGFIVGNLLLESIKSEFSGNSFVIASAIYPQSYVISTMSVIGVTALMAVITSRHIKTLDMAEGLKTQDE